MFDKFESRIIIIADLKAITAIHIGATNTGFMPSMVKKPIIKDALGKPFIPGSSIKGVFRSFAEALFFEKTKCNFNNMCLDSEEHKKKLKEFKEERKHIELAKYVFDNTCVLCHIFGCAESAGKLLFSDAKLINDCTIEVRTGNAIDRELNISLTNHIFDYEVIPRDTIFEVKLILENTNEEEQKVIKTLLHMAKNEMMQIGGSVTRGLGSFCFENMRVGKLCLDNIFTEKELYKFVEYKEFEWSEQNV